MTGPATRKPCDELPLKTRGVRRRAGLLDGVGESGLRKANLLAKTGAGGGNGARRILLSTWHTHQLRPSSSPALRTVTLRAHLHLICVAMLGGNVPLTAGFGGQIGFGPTDFVFILDNAKHPSPGPLLLVSTSNDCNPGHG
ncbi:hypothetical protein CRV24_003669 [Beauveria bassiana]|nr:hypothetical protein CRV24_003669 [Beauveria bassiana]